MLGGASDDRRRARRANTPRPWDCTGELRITPRVRGVAARRKSLGVTLRWFSRRASNGDRNGASEREHFVIARPAGRRNEHLVADGEEGKASVEQRLLRAGGDDDVVGGDTALPMQRARPVGDDFAQREDSLDLRVSCRARVEGATVPRPSRTPASENRARPRRGRSPGARRRARPWRAPKRRSSPTLGGRRCWRTENTTS